MKLRLPDVTTVILEHDEFTLKDSLFFDGGYVQYCLGNALGVSLKSEKQGVKFLILRWDGPIRSDIKVLGDAWERGYGDLSWKCPDPARKMPWYMAFSNGSDSNRDYKGRLTECFGVGVRPAAMALWSMDNEGVTLCLDVRNGTRATQLQERILHCADVYFEEYRDISAFDALCRFCAVMSPAPLLADHPVYGSNNWYYAYGNSSEGDILSDSRFVADMCKGQTNLPYMVIDDGWQPNSCDAPWDRGNARFPDMKSLAAKMKEIGVRPGIWVRYLINGQNGEPRKVQDFPEQWYSMRCDKTLDPSHPAVLDYVASTTKRLVDWGYTLIKHDFSTFDIFGKWGFQTSDHLATGDWGFYDTKKTTAEIIVNLYKTIKENAGDAVIIGCNAIGHLCAGLHEFNRTGDDTSGFEWARTKKMGVNTLAFRLVQNNRFFGADADCVGITGHIDWNLNSQWLKILSHSGSCLFVSCKPDVPNECEQAQLREAFACGATQKDILIPLDWMESKTPCKYLLNGEAIEFTW